MKILLITGKLSLGTCGVCDFTMNLYNHISKFEEVFIEILEFNKVNKKRILEADIILMSYPCPDYGYSLKPHFNFLLSRILGKKIVYIMHEYSYVNKLRKLSILPLLFFSNKIVSVTKEEIKRIPKNVQKRTTYIPIVTNFNIVSRKRLNYHEIDNKELNVSYFGVFYPAKKIEKIIEAVSTLNKSGFPIRLTLIGAKHPKHSDYLEYIRKKIEENNIGAITSLYLNQPEEKVIELLSNSQVCVLLYEEGVTMRRGSFLTALELGLVVITNKGTDTPLLLNSHKGILFIDNKNNLEDLLKKVYTCYSEIQYIPEIENKKIGLVTWEEVAHQYYKMFKLL
jgi:glycosyltransferase involved in cell wall biosynthesis